MPLKPLPPPDFIDAILALAAAIALVSVLEIEPPIVICLLLGIVLIADLAALAFEDALKQPLTHSCLYI